MLADHTAAVLIFMANAMRWWWNNCSIFISCIMTWAKTQVVLFPLLLVLFYLKTYYRVNLFWNC